MHRSYFPVLPVLPLDRQKHIIQRVGPRRDPEATQQVQPAEEHSCHRSEREGAQLQRSP